MDTFKVARLHPAAQLPTRKHPQDAGLDFYTLDAAELAPHSAAILPTGITVEIPAGCVGLLKPKGRHDHLVGAGVVDAGYQGEVLIKIVNPFDRPLRFQAGDAIAQMLLIPILTPPVEEVPAAGIHRQSTSRGATGGIVSQHRD